MTEKVSDNGESPEQSSGKISVAYRRYALIILVLGYTSSHIDRNIVGILVEPIKNDLMLSDTAMGFLTGIAFAIFYATLGMPIALLADRSNRRNIIAWSIAIWSAMTAVCGLAQNFWQLAAARIGVGIGEAGSTPPSHSMMADMYPPEERAGAFSIYALGIYIGIMVGFLLGGWVAHFWSWRVAFFIVGMPGVLIALLVRFTIPEPVRGGTEPAGTDHTPSTAPGIQQVTDCFKELWGNTTTRHIICGMTLTAFIGYGTIAWVAAFLIRTHEMPGYEVGSWLAPLIGIFGGVGALYGGRLAERKGNLDPAWYAWTPAVALFLAVPLIIVYFLTDNWVLFSIFGLDVSILWVISAPIYFLGAFYLGPSYALVQTLTPVNRRALASAISLFIVNIVGLGLGPQTVGIISDLLNPEYGKDSLRYALLAVAMINVWAGVHYYLAGKSLRRNQG